MSVTYWSPKARAAYKMLTVQVSPAMMKLLKAEVFRRDETLSRVVNRALNEHFETGRT